MSTFYNRLQKETQPYREKLYSVPLVQDALKGDVSRDTYLAYLTEAFHHVRHTVPFLFTMGARLPQDKYWLQDAIVEYLEEEKGHEEWILNDIATVGGDKEKVRYGKPLLETQVMNAYNYDWLNRRNPLAFLGMVFMLESTSTQIATGAADKLREGLNLPKTAFTYLLSHGSLDIKHMAFFEGLVNKVTDTQDQEDILDVAKNTFRLFANVLAAIPHKQEQRHAA